MTTLEIRREVDRFVLYFETPKHEVSAYALASALVGLADAVREANAVVNPGYKVEVVVEALSPGSFQATLRTVFTKAKISFLTVQYKRSSGELSQRTSMRSA